MSGNSGKDQDIDSDQEIGFEPTVIIATPQDSLERTVENLATERDDVVTAKNLVEQREPKVFNFMLIGNESTNGKPDSKTLTEMIVLPTRRARRNPIEYHVEQSSSMAEALHMIDNGYVPEIVMLDVGELPAPNAANMQAFNDALSSIGKKGSSIIAVSDYEKKVHAALAKKHGAREILIRPITPAELHIAIDEVLQHRRDQAYLEGITKLAVRDPLTGLYNRRYFDHVLSTEIEKLKKYGGSMAMLFCDIDDFKACNTLHGHDFGDEVLRGVASIMVNSCRTKEDIPVRYGGEEMIILYIDTPLEHAKFPAKRFVDTLNAKKFRTASGEMVEISVSGGLGGVSIKAGELDASIDRFDRKAFCKITNIALYVAKETGKRQLIPLNALEFYRRSEGDYKAIRQTLRGLYSTQNTDLPITHTGITLPVR